MKIQLVGVTAMTRLDLSSTKHLIWCGFAMGRILNQICWWGRGGGGGGKVCFYNAEFPRLTRADDGLSYLPGSRGWVTQTTSVGSLSHSS